VTTFYYHSTAVCNRKFRKFSQEILPGNSASKFYKEFCQEISMEIGKKDAETFPNLKGLSPEIEIACV
jgi:hypothetical protein